MHNQQSPAGDRKHTEVCAGHQPAVGDSSKEEAH